MEYNITMERAQRVAVTFTMAFSLPCAWVFSRSGPVYLILMALTINAYSQLLIPIKRYCMYLWMAVSLAGRSCVSQKGG